MSYEVKYVNKEDIQTELITLHTHQIPLALVTSNEIVIFHTRHLGPGGHP